MKRIHFLEIHDQKWCPASLRDALTRFLAFFIFWGRPYVSVASLLSQTLNRNGTRKVLDLCSGGGGPWPQLLTRVRDRLDDRADEFAVSLTDKFPPRLIGELPDGLSFETDSVDAMSIEPARTGFRTLFTSFHHFRPNEARAVLEDAVRNDSGIAIFEFTRRHPRTMLPYLVTPFIVWVAVPFMRPFRLRDWLWTYPIPILPAVVTFDGIVSCLRTYSPDQCLQLASESDPEGRFKWRSGVRPSLAGGMTYLIGVPKKKQKATVSDHASA
ncbi:MAG: hypothetical protein AB8G99_02860 [Planctomycetaceae bacterium]